MDYHDWSDLGNDIRRMVDDAVNSGDFRRLDENVRRTVTDGLENLGDSLRKGMESFAGEKKGQGMGGSRNVGAPSQPTGKNGRPGSEARSSDGRRYPAGFRTAGSFLSQSPLFAKTFGTRAGGVALLAVGCTVAGGCLIAILVFIIMHLAGLAGTILTALFGVLIIILIAALAAAWAGKGFLGKAKRFDRYVEALRGRTYCGIEELAEQVGRSRRFREERSAENDFVPLV